MISAEDGFQKRFATFQDFYNQMLRGKIGSIIVNSSLVLKPRLNQGRWIVDCPFCNGAELVWNENPSYFFCLSCYNKGSNQVIEVKFPKNRKRVEEVLNKRSPVNQNWTNETISFLEEENRKYLESGVS